jgi:hypothetical protein
METLVQIPVDGTDTQSTIIHLLNKLPVVLARHHKIHHRLLPSANEVQSTPNVQVNILPAMSLLLSRNSPVTMFHSDQG